MHNEKQQRRSKTKAGDMRKKQLLNILVIVMIIMAVLLAIAGVIDEIQDRNSSVLVAQSSKDYYEKSFRSYYPVDFDADLSEDSDYMALDRLIHFTETSGLTFCLDDVTNENLNEGQLFWINYFDTVISGDYQEYFGFFTEEYKNNPVGFEKIPDREFPPQRVYNINIKQIARTDPSDTQYSYKGKPCVYGFYEVSFMILKNDGCFRRDLAENSSRALIFELVTLDAGTDSQKTFIKNLYTPDSLLETQQQ